MRIPLFDIDGTLIVGGNRAHVESFDFALSTVFHLPNASVKDIKIDGMIDTQILMEVAKLYGISEEKSKQYMPDALEAMREYYFMHWRDHKTVLFPGVLQLLEKLTDKNVPRGILTGNVEEIGWGKLELVEIKNKFSFGAFGNLAYKRPDLVPIAVKRAEKALKKTLSLKDFFIVGDTLGDIVCAKENGIPVIAVAQGSFSEKDLTAAGADIVLPNLGEHTTFMEFVWK